MENKENITWTHDFSWDRGKAIITTEGITLTWEGDDPWKFEVSGKVLEDTPFFRAEDWGLAKKYAQSLQLGKL